MNNIWLLTLVSVTQPPAPTAATPAKPRATPAPTRSVGFDYQLFPEIPSDPLIEDKFASWLKSACGNLTLAKTEPRAAFKDALAKASPRLAEVDWVGVQTRIASAKYSVDWKTFATEGSDSQRDVAEISQTLRSACQKMSSIPPATLTDSEVTVLRKVRDDTRLRDVVGAWAPSLEKSLTEIAAEGTGGSQQSQNTASIAPTGGLSDVLIRGMAEFLEKRAQQEALRYLRNNLKDELCKPGETQPFFENVCGALESLGDDASITAIGSYLRAAAERDLRRLPDVALAYVEAKDNELAPVTYTGRLGLAYFAAAKSGRAPLEILWSVGGIAKQSCEAADCKEVAQTIRLTSALAYALRQAGEDWEKGLPRSEPKLMAVYGVGVALLAEARLVTKDSGALLFTGPQLHKFAERPAGIVSAGLVFASKWKDLQSALKNDKVTPDQRRELILAAILDGASAMAQLMRETGGLGDAPTKVEKGARTVVALARVAVDLSERRYAEATIGLAEVLSKSSPSSKLPPGCQRLLPLIVELGSAQSANEVAAIFDAYAAPLGTYELKYEKPMVTINGFLGVLGGWEHTTHDDSYWKTGTAAMFAPIGVHATMPAFKKSWHLGVLVSVLDLGAITTFRTRGNTTGTLDSASTEDKSKPVTADSAPQIGFDQVFSPGAYLTVAPIKKSPFVAGLGLSLSPRLRRITQGEAVEEASALRFGFFLSFDVPILPL